MDLNDGKIRSLQTAVIRTNCIDCLDRTRKLGGEWCRHQRRAERVRKEHAAASGGRKGGEGEAVACRWVD